MKWPIILATTFLLPLFIQAQAPDFSGTYDIVLDYKLDGAISGETYKGTLTLMRGDDNNYSVLLLGGSYPAIVSITGNGAIIRGSDKEPDSMVQVWVGSIYGGRIKGVYSNKDYSADFIATKRP